MSLLRDATGVCFVWPPVQAVRWKTGSPAAAGHALLHAGMDSDTGEGWSERLGILGRQDEGATLTAKTRGLCMEGVGGNLFLFWFGASCGIIFTASRSKLHLFS